MKLEDGLYYAGYLELERSANSVVRIVDKVLGLIYRGRVADLIDKTEDNIGKFYGSMREIFRRREMKNAV